MPQHYLDYCDLLKPGSLTVLADRVCGQKSTLALDWALELARRSGKTALVFSFDRSVDLIKLHLICSRARINHRRYATGNISAEEEGRALAASSELAKQPVRFFDSGFLNPVQVRDYSRAINASLGLSVIVIDSLQALADERDVPESLKQLALELNVAVLALGHIFSPEIPRYPLLRDLEGSPILRHIADTIIFVIPIENDEPHIPLVEICMQKCRFGMGLMSMQLKWDLEELRFEMPEDT